MAIITGWRFASASTEVAVIVQHITIHDRAGNREVFRLYYHDLSEPLKQLVESPEEEFARIAFACHGRGITLHFSKEGMTISGLRIDPMPNPLPDPLERAPLPEALRGIALAAEGGNILIGDPEYGILFSWEGEELHVFGAGRDMQE